MFWLRHGLHPVRVHFPRVRPPGIRPRKDEHGPEDGIQPEAPQPQVQPQVEIYRVSLFQDATRMSFLVRLL